LILDFGENIKRHGPIDSDDYGNQVKKQHGDREKGEGVPGKQCPGCGEEVAGNTRQCECGFIFPANHEEVSSREAVLSAPKRWKVLKMSMSRWRKRQADGDKPDTLRVDYQVVPVEEEGMLTEQTISEWVCLEHEGFAGDKAVKWWERHTNAGAEDSEQASMIDKAIDLFTRGAFAKVLEITTVRDGRWDKITARELGPRPQFWDYPPQPVGVDEWGQPIYEEELPVISSSVEEEDLPF
jgi:DNA repair protein RadD